VFEKSIRALRRLNELGYGDGRSGLRLVLVTNPVGAMLPAAQRSLEAEWKRELRRLHDVSFDSLYTITNMPISRYLEWLLETGNLEGYMRRLVESFNPQAAHGLMCRNTISVGWDGRLYDCDFNQMLDIPVSGGAVSRIRDFDLAALQARTIQTNRHCHTNRRLRPSVYRCLRRGEREWSPDPDRASGQSLLRRARRHSL
jgi:radical SAM/Cys-rich protein